MTRTSYQETVWQDTLMGRKSMVRIRWLLLLALGSLFFVLNYASAETLRVTTWHLEEVRGSAVTNAIETAATALKEIDPDVILLQQVRDWPMCLQLVQALKPAVYNVLVCSRFSQQISDPARTGQAAILAKRKAYFTWSEAWRSQGETKIPGGFVFAAIEVNGCRVAVVSVELDVQLIQSNSAATDPAMRLDRQMEGGQSGSPMSFCQRLWLPHGHGQSNVSPSA